MWVWAAAAGPLLCAQAKDDLALAVHEARGELEIRFRAKPLLVYAFATNQFKPYVRALYTLNGENVLRDAPPDHLHHHGLMYAIRVNGVNFWEQSDAPGVERPVKLLAHRTGVSADGLPQAQFTQLIHWLAPTNRGGAKPLTNPLLIEQRTLTVTVDETAGEVALQWDAAFQTGPAGNVTLHGQSYNGLGLRPPESFNRVAVFQNSEGKPYPDAKQRATLTAKWTSLTGKTARGEVTLALFGQAANPGGPATFFTMLEPFAYLSATQGLDQEPREYAAGEKFRLRYLLTVYNEPKPAEFLQRRYAAWSESAK
jgi:hypothetical protein